jgi:tetratricopeptide (TPR) repeat protein
MRRFRYPVIFGLAVVALTVGTVLAFGRISEPFLIRSAPDEEAGLNAAQAVARPGFAPATAEQYAAFAEEDRKWRDSSAPQYSLAELRARGDGRRSLRQAMQDRVFQHTQQGETGKAIAELERWVSANPRDEDALLALARLLSTAGRTDAAVTRYRQLLSIQSGRRR